MSLDTSGIPIWCREPGGFLENHCSPVHVGRNWIPVSAKGGSNRSNKRADALPSKEQKQTGKALFAFPPISLSLGCWTALPTLEECPSLSEFFLGMSSRLPSEACLLVDSRAKKINCHIQTLSQTAETVCKASNVVFQHLLF